MCSGLVTSLGRLLNASALHVGRRHSLAPRCTQAPHEWCGRPGTGQGGGAGNTCVLHNVLMCSQRLTRVCCPGDHHDGRGQLAHSRSPSASCLPALHVPPGGKMGLCWIAHHAAGQKIAWRTWDTQPSAHRVLTSASWTTQPAGRPQRAKPACARTGAALSCASVGASLLRARAVRAVPALSKHPSSAPTETSTTTTTTRGAAASVH